MHKQFSGTRIRRLRERKAWTQEELADAAQVSPRTVQRAEDGQMSAETLKAIARAFGVAVESISGPPTEGPAISPVLFYARAETLDWLVSAFGLELRVRITDAEGRVVHGELYLGHSRVIVGQPVGKREWTTPEVAGVRTHSLFVRVDDVDEHYARAKAAGAIILSAPEDMHGDRRYLATDPEGHHWWFFSPSVNVP